MGIFCKHFLTSNSCQWQNIIVWQTNRGPPEITFCSPYRALEEGVRDSKFKAHNKPGIRDSNFKQGGIQDSKFINHFWAKWSLQFHPKHWRFRIQISNRSGFRIQIWIPEKCPRFRIQIWSSRALLIGINRATRILIYFLAFRSLVHGCSLKTVVE